MAEHNKTGKLGEELATDYLISKEYTILARNWRFQKAEVDILALKEGILAVVEVKTRSSTSFGTPESFVTTSKIKRMLQAINAYIEANDLDVEIRFDIISVLLYKKDKKIEHFENAFYYF